MPGFMNSGVNHGIAVFVIKHLTGQRDIFSGATSMWCFVKNIYKLSDKLIKLMIINIIIIYSVIFTLKSENACDLQFYTACIGVKSM